ncbi:hypothetical protein F5887DRAFT_1085593 [Amanita rubescens]|nr:hypothetical protein F5887DRAFT_1085593 [Amanita rubescens]
MSNSTPTELTTLIASHTATLVYAIPLLIVSVILTFAGTFLTLDRTRSFPPKHDKTDKFIYSSYESFEKRRKRGWFWWWRLEGGVGGLAVGFAFGVHLATFLALMVPNISTSPPLSSTAFLVVCIISAVLSCALSGRYRIATIVFAGISGGALTSLALSVMLHPPLTGRRVLLVILTILIGIPTIFVCIVSPHISMTQNNAFLVHLPYLVHPLLRFCTASTGSFGLVLSIALLLKPPAASWANVWDRLWVSNGVGWGTSQEKGLTAAWTFFTCLGIVEDWALRRWLGEDPDEKWNNYLLSYVESLPFSEHRAGTFRPLPSLWDRLFHRQTPANPEFPHSFEDDSQEDFDLKSKPLFTENISSLPSPLLNSAIPTPFYADMAPPLSHLAKFKHKSANADSQPRARPSDPLMDPEDDGASDSSDDYDLPPFVKKRRKNGPFAKFHLRLHNPDSRAADSVGFRPLAKRNGDSDSDDDKERGPSDDGVTTVSSATLIGSGGNGQAPSQNSDARAPENVRHPAAPEPTPDFEVDLTSMMPAPLGLGGERARAEADKVPKFIERHVSSKPQTPVSETPPTAPATPEADRTNFSGPSATDLARARVRAIVSGVPGRHSRRGSLAQMPQVPMSPPPLHHAPPSLQNQVTAPPSPIAFPAPVPATPSLINALHRVAVAQQQAYGIHGVSHYGVDGLPAPPVGDANSSKQGGLPGSASNPKGAGLRELNRAGVGVGENGVGGWDEFWKDVKTQARVPIR